MKEYIVGIDEVGRGPLAGPLAVAGVMVAISLNAKKTNLSFPFYSPSCSHSRHSYINHITHMREMTNLNLINLKGIKDSKKLSEKQREEWRKIICKNFKYATAFISPQVIDRIGISKAVRLGAARILRKLLFQRPRGSLQVLVLLDGALFAPKKYDQQTIIKGDEKVPLIAAASIIAKTSRDAKMLQFHKKFPQYKFDAHKGYGTRQHYKMLKKHGLSSIHRRSFI